MIATCVLVTPIPAPAKNRPTTDTTLLCLRAACRFPKIMRIDPTRNFLYISHMSEKSSIRSYNLFGETAELADVLHVETIKARSELHDWRLKPHRHARLHQFLFLTHGGGSAEFDGVRHGLREPCLANVPRKLMIKE